MILPYFLAGLALALLYAGKLNVLLLGDELAVGLASTWTAPGSP